MHRHPTQGIAGSKPRIPKSDAADDKAKKARISKLSEEYLRTRTEHQHIKLLAAQMELAARRGELIEKRLVELQAGYLLTCFRQRVLAEPAALARRLAAGGFLEEKHEHEAQEMVKGDLCAMLEELSELPSRISDPDWMEKIDADLRAEGEGESGHSGRVVTDPSQIRHKTEQSRRRLEKKAAAQRRRRAEGRA